MTVTSEIPLNHRTQTSEAELIEQAQGGSADAFGELVRRHQMEVRWFLCRCIYDAHMIDDLAQEVFLAAMRTIPTLQNKSSLRSWLLSIAHKKSVDYLRAKARQPARSALPVDELLCRHSLTQLSGTLDSNQDPAQWMSDLSDCIRELKPNSQAMVRNYYFENQSAEQIANELNRKPGTVRMALLRIRKLLAKCLKQKMQPGIER